jgi:hypothetical protein
MEIKAMDYTDIAIPVSQIKLMIATLPVALCSYLQTEQLVGLPESNVP